MVCCAAVTGISCGSGIARDLMECSSTEERCSAEQLTHHPTSLTHHLCVLLFSSGFQFQHDIFHNYKSKGSGEFGGSTLRMAAAAGRGVTNVMQRCESAKVTGYLDLSDCGLMYVADAIYLVLKDFSIDKCNLRNNVLTKFPKKMVNKFENMLVLNLEGNQIEEIPNEIAEWSTMRGLNIANNKLTSFPEALYSLKQLTFLDISGNEISDIDVEQLYTSLPGLAQLTVSKTQLSTTQIEELEKNSKKPPKMRLNFV